VAYGDSTEVLNDIKIITTEITQIWISHHTGNDLTFHKRFHRGFTVEEIDPACFMLLVINDPDFPQQSGYGGNSTSGGSLCLLKLIIAYFHFEIN